MTRKPYAKYKPSGIKWLGDVPDTWSILRLKYCLSLNSFKTETNENTLALENIESWTGNFIDTDTVYEGEGVAFREGDILFGKLRPYLAKVYLSRNNGEAIGDLFVLRPFKHLYPEYASYLLRTNTYINIIDGSTYGAKMPRVNWEFMGNLPFPLPPLLEQKAIASYLDRETAKIDALIGKNRELIALLAENRSALISRAVTKGLDPQAKMKPSGVEWLGDVPEGWEVKRIRRVANRIQTGSTPPTSEEKYYEDGDIPWYGPSSFNDCITLSKPVKMINRNALEDGVARIFTEGTVFIVGIGATIGKISSISDNASCNQQITGVTFNSRIINTIYITYLLKQMEIIIKNIAPSATLAIFDQNKIADIIVNIPPIDEQKAIAEYLDRETGKIDALSGKVETVIEKLLEYRSALIGAAVTGKIDVRG